MSEQLLQLCSIFSKKKKKSLLADMFIFCSFVYTRRCWAFFFLFFYSVNYKNIVLQWQYTSDFRKLRCENFQPCTAHPKSSNSDGFNTIDELLYCPVMYAQNNLNMTVEQYLHHLLSVLWMRSQLKSAVMH